MVSWLLVLAVGLAFAISLAYRGLPLPVRLRGPGGVRQPAQHTHIKQDYLVRVGFLAASAAHEMSSPLSTMSVLVREMLHQNDDAALQSENLRTMADQIEVCRRILGELIACGHGAAAASGRIEPVDRFMHQIVSRWEMLRPSVKLCCLWAGPQPAPSFQYEPGLDHAIVNLLDNAADASPDAVQMNCRWNSKALRISIMDRGPGIPAELVDVLGERRLTTKSDKGTGIGLILARTAVQQAGGTLKLSNRIGGGVRAELMLPLQRIRDRDRWVSFRRAIVDALKLPELRRG